MLRQSSEAIRCSRRKQVATTLTAVLALSLCSGQISASARTGTEQEIQSLNARVTRLYEQGKYKQGTTLAEKVLKQGEQIFGPDSPKIATSLNNLAALYQAQGEYLKLE